MEVICIEEKAFYALLEEVIKYTKDNLVPKPKWISGDEVMKILNIKSKTTLQVLRDTGKIRFSQPQKRIILYDVTSIDEYLEGHARETF